MSKTDTGAGALPFSCACDGSGWVQVGEQANWIDTGDGRPGGYLAGWEPLMERCECSIPPMLERLDDGADMDGGW